jgi:predicted RNA-binding protein (virulence factor B family)
LRKTAKTKVKFRKLQFMIKIGEYNTLKAKRQTDNGFYLVCSEDDEVLLPKKYAPVDFQIDDLLEVFVYKDSEDRLVAVTDEPKAIVGDFAYLKVKEVAHVGAFLDWGLEKDLLVPFAEQRYKMEAGRMYIVHVYLDEQTNRIAASSKYHNFLEDLTEDYKVGDDVDLLISNKTDLGYEAIIEDLGKGLIFENEVHQKLTIGDRLVGYIKQIRADGKVDLSLQPVGLEHIDSVSKDILAKLTEHNGTLPYHDKSDSTEINAFFGVSKKAFKKAIGGLYKKKMIDIDENGIKAI